MQEHATKPSEIKAAPQYHVSALSGVVWAVLPAGSKTVCCFKQSIWCYVLWYTVGSACALKLMFECLLPQISQQFHPLSVSLLRTIDCQRCSLEELHY